LSTLEQTFEIQNTPDYFKKALLISAIIHGSFFITTTVKNIFFNTEPLVYESAVRVDLVALPDKLPPAAVAKPQAPPPEIKKEEVKAKPEPAKAKPEPVKKESKTPDAIKLEVNKKKQSSAFQKLKQMEALDKLKKATEVDRRANVTAKIIKGNQISTGSELKGMSLLQHDNYVSSVKRQIYSNWAVPEWLAHKELKTQIIAKFDDKGNLIFKKVYRSSGNPNFDEAALDAIEKSTPVPAPPEALSSVVSNEGILIGFPE
jgi:colicin import membrane protein